METTNTFADAVNARRAHGGANDVLLVPVARERRAGEIIEFTSVRLPSGEEIGRIQVRVFADGSRDTLTIGPRKSVGGERIAWLVAQSKKDEEVEDGWLRRSFGRAPRPNFATSPRL